MLAIRLIILFVCIGLIKLNGFRLLPRTFGTRSSRSYFSTLSSTAGRKADDPARDVVNAFREKFQRLTDGIDNTVDNLKATKEMIQGTTKELATLPSKVQRDVSAGIDEAAANAKSAYDYVVHIPSDVASKVDEVTADVRNTFDTVKNAAEEVTTTTTSVASAISSVGRATMETLKDVPGSIESTTQELAGLPGRVQSDVATKIEEVTINAKSTYDYVVYLPSNVTAKVNQARDNVLSTVDTAKNIAEMVATTTVSVASTVGSVGKATFETVDELRKTKDIGSAVKKFLPTQEEESE